MEEKTHARKPDPGDAAAPKRRFQWLYFMVGAVALLLCLAMICWFSVLPRLVEQRLVGALNGLGFDHVSLQVDEVGLGEARITNICLGGKDPVAIGAITARYKLAEAMGGQLGKVDIEGLELKAVVGKNGLRFPQLENLSLSDELMDQLPFEEISIRSAKLFLENPDGASHIIPVEAKLTRLGSKTMAMQLSAQGKSATLGADVSIGEETVEVSGGTLTLECQELPVPGLSTSLRDVSLRLNFEGKISRDNITVELKTGSDVSAGLNRLSVGDDIDVSELRLTGKIVDPLTLESTADGFKAMGPGGQVQGRLEAQTINWRKDGMQVEARALKTEIVASKDGLVFALQKGTELDWMPGDDFLSSRGIVAKDLRVTLHKLDKPAQLHVTTNGSWIAKIPEAKLGIHSGAMSMEEGNFTCESVNADLNIQADASANNFSVNLLSTANVSTGKIRYEVFQDAPSLEIERTEWKLSAHDGHPAVTSLYDKDIKFAGHVSTENMKVQQGGWKLSALPLNVLLMSNDDGKELSDWRDTHLEFSPAEDWLDGKGIKADSLVLAVDNIPSLKIPQEDNWDEWSLTKSNVQLTADANSIKLIEAGVEAEYVKVSMNLEIAFDEAGLDLDLEKQAGIEVKGVRYERDGQVIQVEARQWNLRKNGSKPLVHLDTKTSELDLYGEVNSKDVSVSGNVVNMGPIPEIQMPIEIRNEKIEFTAKCTLAEGLTAKIEGKITDKKQGYTLGIPLSSETGTALGGLIPALRDLNLPGRLGAEVAVTNNADAPELWKFGVTNLTFGASPIPPIHGEARLTDGGQQFSAECELINGLTAKVEGNRTGKKQSYTLRIPPTKISDKSALGNLFHELKGIEIGGMIGLEAHSDGTKSQVQLSLKDCSLASSDLSAIVGGLSGTIRIDGISPFTTAMAQRITVNSAQLGNLELVNGLTVFRLESGGIFVEEERWSLKQDRDGHFVARNFRLTPGQPVKADIEVRDLDLGIWLGLLTDGQVVASGKLSGRVPVTLNEKSTKLPGRVGDGAFLETKQPGKLQFRSAKWAGDWLETVDPRFRTDSVLKELRQSVVEALQDFSYSSIKFHYDEKTDNMLVAVRGEGKNRHGSVVKFDPTINIKPIASWVNEAYNDLVLLAHLENLVNRDLDNLFGD